MGETRSKKLIVLLAAIVLTVSVSAFLLFMPAAQPIDRPGIGVARTAYAQPDLGDTLPDGQIANRETYRDARIAEGYTSVGNGTALLNALGNNTQRIVLTQDITLTSSHFNSNFTYSGIFDGAGYTLSLDLGKTHVQTGNRNIGGLVPALTGQIKNLTYRVVNASVRYSNATAYMGLMIGYLNGGTITNCRIDYRSENLENGRPSNTDNGFGPTMWGWVASKGGVVALGGFVGVGAGTFRNCTFNMSASSVLSLRSDSVTGTGGGTSGRNSIWDRVGGFIGYNEGGNTNFTNITVAGMGKMTVSHQTSYGNWSQNNGCKASIGQIFGEDKGTTVIDGLIFDSSIDKDFGHNLNSDQQYGYMFGIKNGTLSGVSNVYYARSQAGNWALGNENATSYHGGVNIARGSGMNGTTIADFGFSKSETGKFWIEFSNNFSLTGNGAASGNYVKTLNYGKSDGTVEGVDIHETAHLDTEQLILLDKTGQNANAYTRYDQTIAIAATGVYGSVTPELTAAARGVYGLTGGSGDNVFSKAYDGVNALSRDMRLIVAGTGAYADNGAGGLPLRVWSNGPGADTLYAYDDMFGMTKAGAAGEFMPGKTGAQDSSHVGVYTMKFNEHGTLDGGGRYGFTADGSCLYTVKIPSEADYTKTVTIERRTLHVAADTYNFVYRDLAFPLSDAVVEGALPDGNTVYTLAQNQVDDGNAAHRAQIAYSYSQWVYPDAEIASQPDSAVVVGSASAPEIKRAGRYTVTLTNSNPDYEMSGGGDTLTITVNVTRAPLTFTPLKTVGDNGFAYTYNGAVVPLMGYEVAGIRNGGATESRTRAEIAGYSAGVDGQGLRWDTYTAGGAGAADAGKSTATAAAANTYTSARYYHKMNDAYAAAPAWENYDETWTTAGCYLFAVSVTDADYTYAQGGAQVYRVNIDKAVARLEWTVGKEMFDKLLSVAPGGANYDFIYRADGRTADDYRAEVIARYLGLVMPTASPAAGTPAERVMGRLNYVWGGAEVEGADASMLTLSWESAAAGDEIVHTLKLLLNDTVNYKAQPLLDVKGYRARADIAIRVVVVTESDANTARLSGNALGWNDDPQGDPLLSFINGDYYASGKMISARLTGDFSYDTLPSGGRALAQYKKIYGDGHTVSFVGTNTMNVAGMTDGGAEEASGVQSLNANLGGTAASFDGSRTAGNETRLAAGVLLGGTRYYGASDLLAVNYGAVENLTAVHSRADGTGRGVIAYSDAGTAYGSVAGINFGTVSDVRVRYINENIYYQNVDFGFYAGGAVGLNFGRTEGCSLTGSGSIKVIQAGEHGAADIAVGGIVGVQHALEEAPIAQTAQESALGLADAETARNARLSAAPNFGFAAAASLRNSIADFAGRITVEYTGIGTVGLPYSYSYLGGVLGAGAITGGGTVTVNGYRVAASEFVNAFGRVDGGIAAGTGQRGAGVIAGYLIPLAASGNYALDGMVWSDGQIGEMPLTRTSGLVPSVFGYGYDNCFDSGKIGGTRFETLDYAMDNDALLPRSVAEYEWRWTGDDLSVRLITGGYLTDGRTSGLAVKAYTFADLDTENNRTDAADITASLGYTLTGSALRALRGDGRDHRTVMRLEYGVRLDSVRALLEFIAGAADRSDGTNGRLYAGAKDAALTTDLAIGQNNLDAFGMPAAGSNAMSRAAVMRSEKTLSGGGHTLELSGTAFLGYRDGADGLASTSDYFRTRNVFFSTFGREVYGGLWAVNLGTVEHLNFVVTADLAAALGDGLALFGGIAGVNSGNFNDVTVTLEASQRIGAGTVPQILGGIVGVNDGGALRDVRLLGAKADGGGAPIGIFNGSGSAAHPAYTGGIVGVINLAKTAGATPNFVMGGLVDQAGTPTVEAAAYPLGAASAFVNIFNGFTGTIEGENSYLGALSGSGAINGAGAYIDELGSIAYLLNRASGASAAGFVTEMPLFAVENGNAAAGMLSAYGALSDTAETPDFTAITAPPALAVYLASSVGERAILDEIFYTGTFGAAGDLTLSMNDTFVIGASFRATLNGAATAVADAGARGVFALDRAKLDTVRAANSNAGSLLALETDVTARLPDAGAMAAFLTGVRGGKIAMPTEADMPRYTDSAVMRFAKTGRQTEDIAIDAAVWLNGMGSGAGKVLYWLEEGRVLDGAGYALNMRSDVTGVSNYLYDASVDYGAAPDEKFSKFKVAAEWMSYNYGEIRNVRAVRAGGRLSSFSTAGLSYVAASLVGVNYGVLTGVTLLNTAETGIVYDPTAPAPTAAAVGWLTGVNHGSLENCAFTSTGSLTYRGSAAKEGGYGEVAYGGAAGVTDGGTLRGVRVVSDHPVEFRSYRTDTVAYVGGVVGAASNDGGVVFAGIALAGAAGAAASAVLSDLFVAVIGGAGVSYQAGGSSAEPVIQNKGARGVFAGTATSSGTVSPTNPRMTGLVYTEIAVTSRIAARSDTVFLNFLRTDDTTGDAYAAEDGRLTALGYCADAGNGSVFGGGKYDILDYYGYSVLREGYYGGGNNADNRAAHLAQEFYDTGKIVLRIADSVPDYGASTFMETRQEGVSVADPFVQSDTSVEIDPSATAGYAELGAAAPLGGSAVSRISFRYRWRIDTANDALAEAYLTFEKNADLSAIVEGEPGAQYYAFRPYTEEGVYGGAPIQAGDYPFDVNPTANDLPDYSRYAAAHARDMRLTGDVAVTVAPTQTRSFDDGRILSGMGTEAGDPTLNVTVAFPAGGMTAEKKGDSVAGINVAADGPRNYAVGGLWSLLGGTVEAVKIDVTVRGFNLSNGGAESVSFAFGALAGALTDPGRLGGGSGDVTVGVSLYGADENTAGILHSVSPTNSVTFGGMIGHNFGVVYLKSYDYFLNVKGEGFAKNVFIGGLGGVNIYDGAAATTGVIGGSSLDGMLIREDTRTSVVSDIVFKGVAEGDMGTGEISGGTGAIGSVLGANLEGIVTRINFTSGLESGWDREARWHLTGAEPGAVIAGGGVVGITTGGEISNLAFNSTASFIINDDFGLGKTDAEGNPVSVPHTSFGFFGGIVGLGSNTGNLSVFNNDKDYTIDYGRKFVVGETLMRNVYSGYYGALTIPDGNAVGLVAGRFVNGVNPDNLRGILWMDMQSSVTDLYSLVTAQKMIETRLTTVEYMPVLGNVSSSLNNRLLGQENSGAGVMSGAKVWTTNAMEDKMYIVHYAIFFSQFGDRNTPEITPHVNYRIYGFFDNGYKPFEYGVNIKEISFDVVTSKRAQVNNIAVIRDESVLGWLNPGGGVLGDLIAGNEARNDRYNILRAKISGDEYLIYNSDMLHAFLTDTGEAATRSVGILQNDIVLEQPPNSYILSKKLYGGGYTVTLSPKKYRSARILDQDSNGVFYYDVYNINQYGANQLNASNYSNPQGASYAHTPSEMGLPDNTPLYGSNAYFAGLFVGAVSPRGGIYDVNFVLQEKVVLMGNRHVYTPDGTSNRSTADNWVVSIVGGIVSAVNMGTIDGCTLTMKAADTPEATPDNDKGKTDDAAFVVYRHTGNTSNNASIQTSDKNMCIAGGFAGMTVRGRTSGSEAIISNCTLNMSQNSFIRSYCYGNKAKNFVATVETIPHTQAICGGMAGWLGYNSYLLNSTVNGAGVVDATNVAEIYFDHTWEGWKDNVDYFRSNIYQSAAGVCVGLSSSTLYYRGEGGSQRDHTSGETSPIYTNLSAGNEENVGIIDGIINNWYGFTLESATRYGDSGTHRVQGDTSYRQLIGTGDVLGRDENSGKTMILNPYIVSFSETGSHPNPPGKFDNYSTVIEKDHQYSLNYLGRGDFTNVSSIARPEPYKVYIYDNTDPNFDPLTGAEAKMNESEASLIWEQNDGSLTDARSASVIFKYDVYSGQSQVAPGTFLWDIQGYNGARPAKLIKDLDDYNADPAHNGASLYTAVYDRINSILDARTQGRVEIDIGRSDNWFLYYSYGSVGSASVDKSNYYYDTANVAYYHKQTVRYGDSFALPALGFFDVNGNPLPGNVTKGTYDAIRIYSFDGVYTKDFDWTAATDITDRIERTEDENGKPVLSLKQPAAGSYLVKFNFTGGAVTGANKMVDTTTKTIIFPDGDLGDAEFTLIEVVTPTDLTPSEFALLKTYDGTTGAGNAVMDVENGKYVSTMPLNVPADLTFGSPDVVWDSVGNAYNDVTFRVVPWQYYSYRVEEATGKEGLGYNDIYMISDSTGGNSGYYLYYDKDALGNPLPGSGVEITQQPDGRILATVAGRGVIAPRRVTVRYVQKNYDGTTDIPALYDIAPAIKPDATGASDALLEAPLRFESKEAGNDLDVRFHGSKFLYRTDWAGGGSQSNHYAQFLQAGTAADGWYSYMQSASGLVNYAFHTAEEAGVAGEVIVRGAGTILPLGVTVSWLYKTYDGSAAGVGATFVYDDSAIAVGLRPTTSGFSPKASFAGADVVYAVSGGAVSYNDAVFRVVAITDQKNKSRKLYAFTDSGGKSYNYYIANTAGVTVSGTEVTLAGLGVIVPAVTTLEKAEKTYDGTASLLYTGTGASVQFADALGYNPAGEFSSAHAGVRNVIFTSAKRFVFDDGKGYSVKNTWFPGQQTANYALTPDSAAGADSSGRITIGDKGFVLPKQIDLTEVSKVYDGKIAAGDSTYKFSSALLGGDTIIPTVAYNTADAAVNKTVTVTLTNLTIGGVTYKTFVNTSGGAEYSDYYLETGSGTLKTLTVGVIRPKQIVVFVAPRPYNGSDVVDQSQIMLTGTIGGAKPTITANYSDPNAADNKAVTLAVTVKTFGAYGRFNVLQGTISGTSAAQNYCVASAVVNADLTPYELTIDDFRVTGFASTVAAGTGYSFEFRTSAEYRALGDVRLFADDTIVAVYSIRGNKKGLNAGTYRVYVSVSGNPNYKLATGTAGQPLRTAFDGQAIAELTITRQIVSASQFRALTDGHIAAQYSGAPIGYADQVVCQFTDKDGGIIQADAFSDVKRTQVGNYSAAVTVEAVPDDYAISGSIGLTAVRKTTGDETRFAVYPRAIGVTSAAGGTPYKVYDGTADIRTQAEIDAMTPEEQAIFTAADAVFAGETSIPWRFDSAHAGSRGIVFGVEEFRYYPTGADAEATVYRVIFVGADGTQAASNYTVLATAQQQWTIAAGAAGGTEGTLTDCAVILPRPVSLGFDATKQYDGTTAFSGAVDAAGIVPGDTVSVTGTYADRNAGENIPIAWDAEGQAVALDGSAFVYKDAASGGYFEGGLYYRLTEGSANYCISESDFNRTGIITRRTVLQSQIAPGLIDNAIDPALLRDANGKPVMNAEYNWQYFYYGGAYTGAKFAGVVNLGGVAAAGVPAPWEATLMHADDRLSLYAELYVRTTDESGAYIYTKVDGTAVTADDAGSYYLRVYFSDIDGALRNYTLATQEQLADPAFGADAETAAFAQYVFTISPQEVALENITVTMDKFTRAYGDADFRCPTSSLDGYVLTVRDKYVAERSAQFIKEPTGGFGVQLSFAGGSAEIAPTDGLYYGAYAVWVRALTGGSGNYRAADTYEGMTPAAVSVTGDPTDELIYYVLPRALDIASVSKTYDGTTALVDYAAEVAYGLDYRDGTALTFHLLYGNKNATHASDGTPLTDMLKELTNTERAILVGYVPVTMDVPAEGGGVVQRTFYIALASGGANSRDLTDYYVDSDRISAVGGADYAMMIEKAVITRAVVGTTGAAVTAQVSGYVNGAEGLQTLPAARGQNALLSFVYAYLHLYDNTNVTLGDTLPAGWLKAGDTEASLRLALGEKTATGYSVITNAGDYTAYLFSDGAENYELEPFELCRMHIDKQEITESDFSLVVDYYHTVFGDANMSDPTVDAGYTFNARDRYNGKVFLSSEPTESGAGLVSFEYRRGGATVVPYNVGGYGVRVTVESGFVQNENYSYIGSEGNLVFVANNGEAVYFILPRALGLGAVEKNYDGTDVYHKGVDTVTLKTADAAGGSLLVDGDTEQDILAAFGGKFADKNVVYNVGADGTVTYNDFKITVASFTYRYKDETGAVQSAAVWYLPGTNYTFVSADDPKTSGAAGFMTVGGVGIVKPVAVTVGKVTKMYDGTDILKYVYDPEAPSAGNVSAESGFGLTGEDKELRAAGSYGGTQVGPQTLRLEYVEQTYGGVTYRVLVNADAGANAGNYYAQGGTVLPDAGGGSGFLLFDNTHAEIVRLVIDGTGAEGKMTDFRFGGFLYDGTEIASSGIFYNNGFFFVAGKRYTLADFAAELRFSGGGVVRKVDGAAGANGRVTVQGITSAAGDVLTFSFRFIAGGSETDGVSDAGVYQFVLTLENSDGNYAFGNNGSLTVGDFVINRQVLTAENIALLSDEIAREYDGTARESGADQSAFIAEIQSKILGFRVLDKSGNTLSLLPDTGMTVSAYRFSATADEEQLQPYNAGSYALWCAVGGYGAGNYTWADGMFVPVLRADDGADKATPFVIAPKTIAVTAEELSVTRDFDGTLYYEYAPIAGERVLVGDYGADAAATRAGVNSFDITPVPLYVELSGTQTNPTLANRTPAERAANYRVETGDISGKLRVTVTIEAVGSVAARRFAREDAAGFALGVGFSVTGLRGLQFMGVGAADDLPNREVGGIYDLGAYAVDADALAAVLDVYVNGGFNDETDTGRYKNLRLTAYQAAGGDFIETRFVLSGEYDAAGSGFDEETYTDRYSFVLAGSGENAGSRIATSAGQNAAGQYRARAAGSQGRHVPTGDGSRGEAIGTPIATAEELRALLATDGVGYLVTNIDAYDAGDAPLIFGGKLYGNGYSVNLTGRQNISGDTGGYLIAELAAGGVIADTSFVFASDHPSAAVVGGLVVGRLAGTADNVSVTALRIPAGGKVGGLAGVCTGVVTDAEVTPNAAAGALGGAIAYRTAGGVYTRLTLRFDRMTGGAAPMFAESDGTQASTVRGVIDMRGGFVVPMAGVTYQDVYTVDTTLSGDFVRAAAPLGLEALYPDGYAEYYFASADKTDNWTDNVYDPAQPQRSNRTLYYNPCGTDAAALAIEILAPRDRFIWEAVAHNYLSDNGAGGHLNVSLNRYVALFPVGTTLRANGFTAPDGTAHATEYITEGVNLFTAAIGIRGTSINIQVEGNSYKEVEYDGSEKTHRITVTVNGEKRDITVAGREAGYYDNMILETGGNVNVDDVTYDTPTRSARVFNYSGGGEKVLGAVLVIYPRQIDADAGVTEKPYDGTDIAERRLTVEGGEYYLTGVYYDADGNPTSDVARAVGVDFANAYNASRKVLTDKNGKFLHRRAVENKDGTVTYQYVNIVAQIGGKDTVLGTDTPLTDATGALAITAEQYMRVVMQLTDYDAALMQDAGLAGTDYGFAYVLDIFAERGAETLFEERYYGVARLRAVDAAAGAANYAVRFASSSTDALGAWTTVDRNAKTRFGTALAAGAIRPLGLLAQYDSDLEQSYRAALVSPKIRSLNRFEAVALPLSMSTEQRAAFEDFKNNFVADDNIDVMGVLAAAADGGVTVTADGLYYAAENTRYSELALPTVIKLSETAGASADIAMQNVAFSFDPTFVKLRYFLRDVQGRSILATREDFLMIGSIEGDYHTLNYVLTNDINCKSALLSPIDWSAGGQTRAFEGSIVSADGGPYAVTNFVLRGSAAHLSLFAAYGVDARIAGVTFANVVLDSGAAGDVVLDIVADAPTRTDVNAEGRAVTVTAGTVILNAHGGADIFAHMDNARDTIVYYAGTGGVLTALIDELTGEIRYLPTETLGVAEIYALAEKYVLGNIAIELAYTQPQLIAGSGKDGVIAVTNFRNLWAWMNVCPWLMPIGDPTQILRPTLR